MRNILGIVKAFVDEMRSSNSSLYKKEVLRKWLTGDYASELVEVLRYVYNYDYKLYVTSDSIKKHMLCNSHKLDASLPFKALLDSLSSRQITGHEALGKCEDFIISTNEEYIDIFYDIIDKDLKIGISGETINKVCPDTVKVFNVCLAQKYDPDKTKLNEEWIIERKLDGCRMQLVYKNENDIKCYSRKGIEFTTLQKVIDDVKGKLPNNTVLDGELCIIDENGNEDFQSIMKVIKRKDYTIENPMYKVFDCLQMKDFEEGTSQEIYSQRVNRLNYILSNNDFKTISPVNYERYSEEAFERWKQYVIDNNWEGLMFRKDTYYEGKRTSNLLKYKTFNDAEYIVEGVEEGIVQEVINGKAHKIKAIGSLIITHKGNKVNVGSGLTLSQRKEWHKDSSLIIGKTITVQYFEELKDQNGNYSLRFPTLKYVYDEKRDV